MIDLKNVPKRVWIVDENWIPRQRVVKNVLEIGVDTSDGWYSKFECCYTKKDLQVKKSADFQFELDALVVQYEKLLTKQQMRKVFKEFA